MMRLTQRTAVGDVFTELAPLWRDEPGRADRIARLVVRHVRPGGHVLDVGCGTGAVLSRIRTLAAAQGKRIGRTVGVDVASGMVARARMRRRVRAVAGDAAALPLIDQYFDVVVATDVVRFAEDPERVMRELVRATMPGGTIVLELVGTNGGRNGFATRTQSLPAASLLRRYLELRRTHAIADARSALLKLGCEIEEWPARWRPVGSDAAFLSRVAKATGLPVAVGRTFAEINGHGPRSMLLVARVPGPRSGPMPISVQGLPMTPVHVEKLLSGLPPARGYQVVVKPLRWRTRPHVQAFCEFTDKRITIQVPQPFYPFEEEVPYRAKRIQKGRRIYFRWYRRTLRFRRPDELIRYLYLHEYYHWYLREVRGRRSAAETACDRFALQQLGRGTGGYVRDLFVDR